MLTFSGVHFFDDYPRKTPTIEDIAVMQGRMCRYNGACKIFWPVLIHSICVAELLPEELKLYGLLHDAGEIILSDIPTPVKVGIPNVDSIEDNILSRIYEGFGIPMLDDPEKEAIVKSADTRILYSECRLFGPENITKYLDLRKDDFESDNIVNAYVVDYVNTKYDGYEGIFSPSGKYIQDFIHRFIFLRNELMGIPSLVTGGDCFISK